MYLICSLVEWVFWRYCITSTIGPLCSIDYVIGVSGCPPRSSCGCTCSRRRPRYLHCQPRTGGRLPAGQHSRCRDSCIFIIALCQVVCGVESIGDFADDRYHAGNVEDAVDRVAEAIFELLRLIHEIPGPVCHSIPQGWFLLRGWRRIVHFAALIGVLEVYPHLPHPLIQWPDLLHIRAQVVRQVRPDTKAIFGAGGGKAVEDCAEHLGFVF